MKIRCIDNKVPAIDDSKTILILDKIYVVDQDECNYHSVYIKLTGILGMWIKNRFVAVDEMASTKKVAMKIRCIDNKKFGMDGGYQTVLIPGKIYEVDQIDWYCHHQLIKLTGILGLWDKNRFVAVDEIASTKKKAKKTYAYTRSMIRSSLIERIEAIRNASEINPTRSLADQQDDILQICNDLDFISDDLIELKEKE
jgi:hypothetical protein